MFPTYTKLHNQKVQVYRENDNTYLAIEGTTYSNNNDKIQVILPKIDINSIKIDIENNYDYNYNLILPPKINRKASITVELLPNEKNEFAIVKIDKPTKKMTKEEIEKELGYKVEII